MLPQARGEWVPKGGDGAAATPCKEGCNANRSQTEDFTPGGSSSSGSGGSAGGLVRTCAGGAVGEAHQMEDEDLG